MKAPADAGFEAWLDAQAAAAPEFTPAQLQLIHDIERGLARDTA